jgi:chromosome partitioning protein
VAHILAVANQKGGVAKTTTVASLGTALAERGRRVLLVDLDPQACLTFSLGLDPDSVEESAADVLLERLPANMVVQPTTEGPDLLPANLDLTGCEARLLQVNGREHRLRTALAELADRYDDILIDCPPTLGVLTVNGLTAAAELIIPLQCETLGHRGVGQLLDTVTDDVQRVTNPGLEVLGVLPTMYDGRTNHAREVLADISGRYGLRVLEPPIPRSVRFAEAPAAGRTVLTSARRSRGAEAYRELATALLAARTPAPAAR